MITATLIRVFQKSAGRTLSLRFGVVAVNFCVMMGLAALLGLDIFGQLVFLWGVALVMGTVLSLGGPLILLRRLTDGVGLRGRDIVGLTLIYPAALGVLAWVLLNSLWPTIPWMAVLLTGFFVNALTCLASVMRALGSVQWSMTLRDAGPQLALGFSALAVNGSAADSILLAAAGVMAGVGALTAFRCLILLILLTP